jgi:hypothetical protein
MIAAVPLTPVVQVNAPTVKVWPASRIMKVGKVTIWLAMESTCTPPTWRATIDEI